MDKLRQDKPRVTAAKLLLVEDMPMDVLQSRDSAKAIPPLHGALLKNEQDVMLLERLAFLARRER